MEILIIPVLWCVLALWGIKLNTKEVLSPLSKENSEALRGIAALEIVLGHMAMYLYTESAVFEKIRKTDVMFVGIFLVLSGYGVAYSICQKKDYMRFFLLKKFFHLFLPVYFIYAIGAIVIAIKNENIEDLRYVIDPVNFAQSINWFILEIFGCYIITYLLVKIFLKKRFLKNDLTNGKVIQKETENKKVVNQKIIDKDVRVLGFILSIIAIIFSVVGFYFRIDKNMYSVALCYPFGVLFYSSIHKAGKKELLQGNKNRIFVSLIIIMLAIFSSLLFIRFELESGLMMVLLKNVSILLFIAAILCCLSFFSFGNAVSNWLGSISYEIYLVHILTIGICRDLIGNNLLGGIVAILLTIIVAWLMHKLFNSCKSLIEKLFMKKI